MTAAPDTRLLALGHKTQPVPLQPEAAGIPTSALRPGQALVTLPEEIDASNDLQVIDALARAALEDRTAVLVADAGRTSYCGSTGVTALMRAHDQAAASGVQLRVVAGSPGLRRIMELTGADQVLDIYLSLDAALAGRPSAAPKP